MLSSSSHVLDWLFLQPILINNETIKSCSYGNSVRHCGEDSAGSS